MPKSPSMPCGPRFCPVAMRLLWPIKDIRVRHIATIYGVTTHSEIDRRAEELGIYGQRPHRRIMSYSLAEFRRLWADETITLEDIGAKIGMVSRVVTLHARKHGLPHRKGGSKPTYSFDDEFDAMWAAKVSQVEMAKHYGGCSKSLIHVEAMRRGLEPRPRGKLTPLPVFLETRAMERLAQAMRHDAEVAAVTRKIRSAEHGYKIPATVLRRAEAIVGERGAA